jgi:very-short-patch-repair endonuclease
MQKPAMFYGASPFIFEKARKLRKSMTESEQLLWQHLKKRQLNGFKFRRQHPMAKFIADFYCHSVKLVIEVDGGIHRIKDRKEYDILRTNELDQLGVTVIRFTNEEVENNIELVLKKIAAVIDG